MEITFQMDKEATVVDLGVSLKSSEGNDGISIRYEQANTWVLQSPKATGEYKVINALGTALTPNEDHTLKVGQHGDRLVISINGVLIYDGTDFLDKLDQSDHLGQFGLYSRGGSSTFKVKSINIKGSGVTEQSKVRYEEDYETTTTSDLNWNNVSKAEVIDDGTGNKVLEVTATDKRVTDLNSPALTDGTLSLRYKVQKTGSGFAFGFRHNDTSNIFSEIGIDGSGVWVPESSSGWGSNLGLPVPEQGVWNDLMFNFEGKQVTIYLNKELIGVREFANFTDGPGKFGLRLRNATLLIDDVIYTEEILVPEVVKSYENDFEDGITGDWSKDVSIIQDGNNGILQIPSSQESVTLAESTDLQLDHGTMSAKVKPVNEDISFKFGNASITWDGSVWTAVVDGVTTEFEGDLANVPVVEKKWNNLAIKFSDNELVMSINGKEATAKTSNKVSPTLIGLHSSGAVYLDDLIITEKLLALNTEVLEDKFEYAEYYTTETVIDYSNLGSPVVKDGRLEGTIAPNTSAINNEIKETAHGVYQFKLKADKDALGFAIGNSYRS